LRVASASLYSLKVFMPFLIVGRRRGASSTSNISQSRSQHIPPLSSLCLFSLMCSFYDPGVMGLKIVEDSCSLFLEIRSPAPKRFPSQLPPSLAILAFSNALSTGCATWPFEISRQCLIQDGKQLRSLFFSGIYGSAE